MAWTARERSSASNKMITSSTFPATSGPQQELRRVGLRLEVDHDKWMLDRVTDVVVRQPMAARRTVDIHTLLV
jgi:hypothetical protein